MASKTKTMNGNGNTGGERVNKWWLQTFITIGTILVAMSIAWGAYSTKVTALEKRVDQVQTDHDLLIALNTKMDLMMKNMEELKSDLKKHIEATK